MHISTASGDPWRQETPLLVFSAWEDETLPDAIANLIEADDWSGRFKQALLLYPRGAIAARRLLLLGLGKQSDATVERLTEIAALAVQRARELHVERYTLTLPNTDAIDAAHSAQAIAEGSLLGIYRYVNYKTDSDSREPDELAEMTLLTSTPDDAIEQGVAAGTAIARGVMLARDLANGPGNDITPTKLGETAEELGRTFGIKVTVLGVDELKRQGFGGLLGVAQGSTQPPRFIVMEYGAELQQAPTVCLVGKGITFDSGGISIKPAERMDEMKTDMSGAAAVLGAMHAVCDLKLPIHVVGLISTAENMPSSTAYKPGDILTTLSGKTIEVLNTDAEGRIVLADALFYAQRYQPNAIIDLATLTGAIVVALGTHATGLMSNDDALAERLIQAGDATGERVWRMPLWEPYKDMIKSEVADIKNTGGRQGGALTAAAFLSHFVGANPWVHLDIAGTAWTDRSVKAYAPKGATGVGVRLLVQALRTWSAA
jgi:leucyl aminopeptidase